MGRGMAKLTVPELRAMKDGDRLTEAGGRGEGSLRFRKTGGRVRVYFRFTKPDGKRDELTLGWYDEAGRDGWTLARVRKEAAKVREQYQSGSGDLRADQEAAARAKQEADKAKKQAVEAAAKEAEARAKYTLRALCEAYVGHLEAKGKTGSAGNARSVFKVHLYEADPELANTPAGEVQPEHIADRLRAIRGAGKDRTAGVLRSYLNAAFTTAVGAKFDTGASAVFNGFNLRANPVSVIKAIKVRAGNRTLSEDELRQYVGSLGGGIIDWALLLALLAGGQRMSQLLRARVGDWDGSNLRLWDGKGRRTEAREHLLPLGPKGAELVEDLIQRAREEADKHATAGQADPNPSLFLSTGGAVVAASTPGKRVTEIAADMKGGSFDLRDVRRTVETRLAGLGISRDVRAQLLSHGLGGVQNQHYDRHSYMDEKRAALVTWEGYLTELETGQKRSNVVRMRG